MFSRHLAGFVLDAFTGRTIDDSSSRETADPELDQLTPREREVLRLIARGYAYKEVATELGISIKTVESHVSAVLRKLQLSNRHQLTNWASQRRLLCAPGTTQSLRRSPVSGPVLWLVPGEPEYIYASLMVATVWDYDPGPC